MSYQDVMSTLFKNLSKAEQQYRIDRPLYSIHDTPVSPSDYLGNYNRFFQDQVEHHYFTPVPHRYAGTGGSSSAIIRDFLEKRLRVGVVGLYGCTSIIIVSRRGVYISHLFESPGFKTPNNAGVYVRPGDFEKDILQAVPHGNSIRIKDKNHPLYNELWLPSPMWHTHKGGKFDPNDPDIKLRAIVVTPINWSGTEQGPYEYGQQIRRIVDWISKEAKLDAKPIVYSYTPINKDTSEDTMTPQGKILCQYDPDKYTSTQIVHERESSTAGRGINIWIMNQDGKTEIPIYGDTWDSDVRFPNDSIKYPSPEDVIVYNNMENLDEEWWDRHMEQRKSFLP